MVGPLEFFLVTLPGLEDLVQAEMAEWFPDLPCQSEHGGVTVQAPLETGLSMNLALKTPTRILLRAVAFRCRDFPKLYNKILEFPWENWIDLSTTVQVEAATRTSRLKIKKRIESTGQDAWTERQKKRRVMADPNRQITLYVRLVNDECTLSLDTSGERLHKRGIRQHIGEAPLRETIAAALIQWVGRNWPASRDVEIVDPMMGSGVFFIEAFLRDQIIDQRTFSGAFRQKFAAPTLRVSRPKISSAIGFEVDLKTLEVARTNLSRLMNPQLHQLDFFQAPPLPKPSGERWVFVNPPYGERLKVKEPLAEYYERLFDAIAFVATPTRICVLLPSKAVKGRFRLPAGWKVVGKRPFLNGGIPVVAFVFNTDVK